ncbi:MAG: sodium:calcium antiporter [Cyanobacteria bacterium P01_D01_bin.6]
MNVELLLLYVLLAIASTAIVWQGSFMLETAADRLATYYQLPEVFQGAVIAAVGSSFPELSSTVLATLIHGQFELGIAAIVGSAIFNILVIPGISGLVGKPLISDRILVYKDAQFYITSVTVLLLAFAFAIIYNPVPGAKWEGIMNRPIALIPVALYGLYIFLQQQDMSEYQPEGGPPVDIRVGREWLRLLVSLVLIVASVEGLVTAAIGFGEVLRTPSFLWGITVIAAGTSLPDAFVSIRAARQGRSIISLANVLGSNIFDLLVALPVGVLIAGASVVDFSVAAPMMGVLTFATIVLFAFLRTRLTLSKFECWTLLGMYVAFIGWMALETAGVTHLAL